MLNAKYRKALPLEAKSASLANPERRAASPHKIEYTTPASRTALRMIVVTPATSRMESCLGLNAMLVLWVIAA